MLTKTSKDWPKIEFNGEFALRHVNLLIQKTTADDDEKKVTEVNELFSEIRTKKCAFSVFRSSENSLIGFVRLIS